MLHVPSQGASKVSPTHSVVPVIADCTPALRRDYFGHPRQFRRAVPRGVIAGDYGDPLWTLPFPSSSRKAFRTTVGFLATTFGLLQLAAPPPNEMGPPSPESPQALGCALTEPTFQDHL
ncbi:hypothetical protein RchiOBHm_Chr7g0193301 [Rosa chinensis]|uniref:Uncharacterized protein n=1 Tax=Rosa chinensis TaxID=74649 RepID=A0A2P6P5W0_ROSCH|nr:hypothetical protein RchiOBHm_Chr7g0193301 [Rosa chinensis]